MPSLHHVANLGSLRRREALLAVTALQPSAAVSRPAGALRRQALLLGRAPRGPLTSAALQCQVRHVGRFYGALVCSYPSWSKCRG